MTKRIRNRTPLLDTVPLPIPKEVLNKNIKSVFASGYATNYI